MKTSEILKELEEHLKTPAWQRDPQKSDQLMGYAMIQLTEARELVREVVLPRRYIPDGAYDIEDDKRRRAFLA